MIPLVDLRAQHAAIREEVDRALARVLAGATFVGGDEVRRFNAEFGAYCGAHAVGVGNGTDALFLALRSLDIGPGDEVILPSHTFAATGEAVRLAGAQVVFADVESATYTLDPASVREKISGRTRAIIAVHLYGQPAAVDALAEVARAHGLFLIEDAAQAHGARFDGRRTGSLGDIAAFSFYPSKNLGAYGDAGAVVSRDPALIARAAMLADHGRTDKHVHAVEGVNSRLDALQAAVLRVKLPHLDEWNRRRREIADLYADLLSRYGEVRLLATGPGRTHVYHLYVIAVPRRDALRRHLKARGVATGIHYPTPLHLQPAYRHRAAPGDLPRTEAAAASVLSLPMYPEMTGAQVRYVASAVGAFLAGRRHAVRA